jgi:hypothetical protein
MWNVPQLIFVSTTSRSTSSSTSRGSSTTLKQHTAQDSR